MSGYRKCEDCPAEQTRLYEYALQEHKWIDGRFVVPDYEQPVLVFASSSPSYLGVAYSVLKEIQTLRKNNFFWVRDRNSWDFVKGLRDPIVVLADDWLESEVIADYRFRMLIATGHI